LSDNGHDGNELKNAMAGVTYTECPRCGKRTFMVWDQQSAEAWFIKHLEECPVQEVEKEDD
jgi:hypothetical protein